MIGIDHPIIQAGMGTFTSAELVAAVSNAGGLGSIGAGATPLQRLQEQLNRVRELTDRPYAVNFTLSPKFPDPEAVALTLAAGPRLVSLALGDPVDYVKRVHDAGILLMHQVTTVQQARQAAERGADIIIAQGGEAGGFGGIVTGMVLIPQVVDAVRPVPVVAAGGIADGRGLAAALVLGAQGVNVGTRFIASLEAPVSPEWKQAILAAESQDTFKAELWNDIFPLNRAGYPTVPRVLASPFITEWQDRRGQIRENAEHLREEIGSAAAQGRFGDLFPFTGQAAGFIHEILPAAEIVREMVSGAETALRGVLSQVHVHPN
ncbi:MAG TPA: nitronate monooxygenase, partial [Anaerolineaceae bacterium]